LCCKAIHCKLTPIRLHYRTWFVCPSISVPASDRNKKTKNDCPNEHGPTPRRRPIATNKTGNYLFYLELKKISATNKGSLAINRHTSVANTIQSLLSAVCGNTC